MARRLPDGAAVVTGGLLVAGVCIYAFLSLAARDLGPDRYAVLAVLWALVFLAGPGLFTPLEQEAARALASRRARGEAVRPVVVRLASVGVGAGVGLALVLVALAAPLADALFAGDRIAVVALALSLPGYAAVHLARGALLGTGRYRGAAGLIAGEAVLRLVAGGVVWLADGGVRGYALVVGLAPLAAVAVVVALAAARPHEAGRASAYGWRELSRVAGALLAASVFSTAMLNVGPVIARLATSDERIVALLFAGLLLVRPPLYLWQGLTAALLPALTRAVEAGRRAEVRAGLLRLAGAVVVLAAVSVAVVLAAGPALGSLLFGAGFELDRADLVLLALATCAFMLAQAVGQGLVAVGRPGWVAGAWGAGLLVVVAVSLLEPASPRTVETALLAGCVVSALVMVSPFARLAPD